MKAVCEDISDGEDDESDIQTKLDDCTVAFETEYRFT